MAFIHSFRKQSGDNGYQMNSRVNDRLRSCMARPCFWRLPPADKKRRSGEQALVASLGLLGYGYYPLWEFRSLSNSGVLPHPLFSSSRGPAGPRWPARSRGTHPNAGTWSRHVSAQYHIHMVTPPPPGCLYPLLLLQSSLALPPRETTRRRLPVRPPPRPPARRRPGPQPTRDVGRTRSHGHFLLVAHNAPLPLPLSHPFLALHGGAAPTAKGRSAVPSHPGH